MASAGRQQAIPFRTPGNSGSEPGRYRQEAARCRQLAELSHVPEACRQWLSLAEAYLDLAEAAEIIEASGRLARRLDDAFGR